MASGSEPECFADLDFRIDGNFGLCRLLVFIACQHFPAYQYYLCCRFSADCLFSYPILSTDIFSYIYSDRVLVEYGQNPWLVKPGVFPDDPFGLLADWTEQTKVYGLVNQIIYLPAAVLGGGKLLPTVVTYKLVALIYLLLTLAIVIGLVRDLEEVKQANIIRALFWNPLLVLEFAGAGHNDIAMAFSCS